jgi:hypothetical protein
MFSVVAFSCTLKKMHIVTHLLCPHRKVLPTALWDLLLRPSTEEQRTRITDIFTVYCGAFRRVESICSTYPSSGLRYAGARTLGQAPPIAEGNGAFNAIAIAALGFQRPGHIAGQLGNLQPVMQLAPVKQPPARRTLDRKPKKEAWASLTPGLFWKRRHPLLGVTCHTHASSHAPGCPERLRRRGQGPQRVIQVSASEWLGNVGTLSRFLASLETLSRHVTYWRSSVPAKFTDGQCRRGLRMNEPINLS